jgi:hypothetical protein
MQGNEGWLAKAKFHRINPACSSMSPHPTHIIVIATEQALLNARADECVAHRFRDTSLRMQFHRINPMCSSMSPTVGPHPRTTLS